MLSRSVSMAAGGTMGAAVAVAVEGGHRWRLCDGGADRVGAGAGAAGTAAGAAAGAGAGAAAGDAAGTGSLAAACSAASYWWR